MQDFMHNHERGFESGLYGSVRADIQPETIPQALGSKSGMSPGLPKTQKIKKEKFRVLGKISPTPRG